MPPLRGSVKLQFSSTKRWGVSAWVSMTMADLWTAAGSVMDSFLGFLWGFFVAMGVAGCCNWGVCATVGKGLSASPASKSADTDRRHFFMMGIIVSYAKVARTRRCRCTEDCMLSSEQPSGSCLPSVYAEVMYGTRS